MILKYGWQKITTVIHFCQVVSYEMKNMRLLNKHFGETMYSTQFNNKSLNQNGKETRTSSTKPRFFLCLYKTEFHLYYISCMTCA